MRCASGPASTGPASGGVPASTAPASGAGGGVEGDPPSATCDGETTAGASAPFLQPTRATRTTSARSRRMLATVCTPGPVGNPAWGRTSCCRFRTSPPAPTLFPEGGLMADRKKGAQRDPEHRDPITNAPGAHPVGVGAGAGAAGVAGAAIGGAVAGPVGAFVGAAVGAFAGGLGGKAAAEAVNPTVEDDWWRENFSGRPY